MSIIHRQLKDKLKSLMTFFPIVTVLGPRQSGKTTLVRDTYPDLPYVSLENQNVRNKAAEDPISFLENFPNGAILDEIQNLPILLSYLQGIVDEKNQNGLFILTGSHQLDLHQGITQSLAGRTAILTLLPLSLSEIKSTITSLTPAQIILKGFYPRLHINQIPVEDFYLSYLQTYVEKDVRQIINLRDLSKFQDFINLCASHVGCLINYENFSKKLGVTSQTIRNWFSILEASYIVFRLSPFYENLGKRIIKSHKLYFYDTGLACHLSQITTLSELDKSPLFGGLFENLVILDIYKNGLNTGQRPLLYFFRDSNQNEVDLIIKSGLNLIPVEIKSSKTFNSSFLDGLKYFKNTAQAACREGYLIYTGEDEQKLQEFTLLNFRNLKETIPLK